MNMYQNVNSSVISAVAFYGDEVVVQFRRGNGYSYIIQDESLRDEFEEIVARANNAEEPPRISVGVYFNRNIGRHYQATRL